MSEWIPVTEKLPVPSFVRRDFNMAWSDYVLVYGVTKDGERGIGITCYCYESGQDSGWCEAYIHIDSGLICEILAWMPLPEPYTEE